MVATQNQDAIWLLRISAAHTSTFFLYARIFPKVSLQPHTATIELTFENFCPTHLNAVSICKKLLKSQLAARFTIYRDYGADFSEFDSRKSHRPFHMRENSQKPARCLIYSVKRLQSWLLRFSATDNLTLWICEKILKSQLAARFSV